MLIEYEVVIFSAGGYRGTHAITLERLFQGHGGEVTTSAFSPSKF